MKTLYKWLLIAVLAFGALTAYSYGSSTGVFLFIIAGLVFELGFWFTLLGKKKSSART